MNDLTRVLLTALCFAPFGLTSGCTYEFDGVDTLEDCQDACDDDELCFALCLDELDDRRDWLVDSDGDGIPDDREFQTNTSPDDDDTDDDGILDGHEDPDGDGFDNLEELAAGTDPADGSDAPNSEPCDSAPPSCSDACTPDPCGNSCECEQQPDPDEDVDGDGLSHAEEGVLGTNPEEPDSDHDGLDDGAEVDRGTDPTEPDTDDDGYTDGEELDCGSSPLDPFMTCCAP